MELTRSFHFLSLFHVYCPCFYCVYSSILCLHSSLVLSEFPCDRVKEVIKGSNDGDYEI